MHLRLLHVNTTAQNKQKNGKDDTKGRAENHAGTLQKGKIMNKGLETLLTQTQDALTDGERTCLTCRSYRLIFSGKAARCESELAKHRHIHTLDHELVRDRRKELIKRAQGCDHYDGEE